MINIHWRWYKLHLTAVAGSGALWWPLGSKALLSSPVGPDHTETQAAQVRFKPRTILLWGRFAIALHIQTQWLLTFSRWGFLPFFPGCFFLSFYSPLSSLSLCPQVFPSWAAPTWVEYWSDQTCQEWGGEKDALSNISAAPSINTEVLSLTTPSQHILENPWLPGRERGRGRAPWRPSCQSQDSSFYNFLVCALNVLHTFILVGRHCHTVTTMLALVFLTSRSSDVIEIYSNLGL